MFDIYSVLVACRIFVAEENVHGTTFIVFSTTDKTLQAEKNKSIGLLVRNAV